MDRRKIIVKIMETPDNDTSSTSESSIILNSSTNSATSTSNEEESKDVLLFPLMHHLMSIRKRHRIENYLQVVDSWTNQEFKEHLRLNDILY